MGRKQKDPSAAVAEVVDPLDVKINEKHAECMLGVHGGGVAAIECGELLSQKKGQLKHGEWEPWVDRCFHASKQTASLYMNAYDRATQKGVNLQDIRDLPLSEVLALLTGKKLIDGPRDSLTGEVEWYTPALYIEHARKVMGTIDLDPASCDKANEIVRAKRFFTAEDDGLEQPWSGNVFCNPPYKADLVAKFTEKLCAEHECASVPQAIYLTNNATDTKWWHQAARAARAICFTEGRVSVYNSAGESKSPPYGHTFFYFGENCEAFETEFTPIGIIWV